MIYNNELMYAIMIYNDEYVSHVCNNIRRYRVCIYA